MPVSKLNLILDLDHTLISTADNQHTIDRLSLRSIPELLPSLYYIKLADNEREYAFNTCSKKIIPGPLKKAIVKSKANTETVHMWGILRPKVHDFIKWAHNFFETVSFWSAGETDYVNAIVKELYKPFDTLPNPPKPYFVWSRPMCHMDCSGLIFKPLTEVYKAYPKQFHAYNTIILDDSKHTADYNPDNLVLIPQFIYPEDDLVYLMYNVRKDMALQQFVNWIEIPSNYLSSDIRKVNKDFIFY